MIKEDQLDRGTGMIEINNFMDECISVKQAILVGFREKISGFDDYELDEGYPLYAQTQQFMYETAQRQARHDRKQQDRKQQEDEDFPTLGGGSGGRPKGNGRGGNNLQSHSIYNVDNTP
jgi:hypothetical protein